MKNKLHLLLAAAILIITACDKKEQSSESNISISPEAGATYKAGDEVTVKLTFPADAKPDSVVYLVVSLMDTVKLATKTDSAAISIKTDTMPLGIKVVTAKLYKGGQAQDVSTNFVLMSAKAPECIATL